MKSDWVKVFLFVFVSEMAGILGGFFTIDAIPAWYANLNKPLFSPPNWVFGPVWTVLYLLIGLAGYKIYKSKNRKLIKVFFIQLFLNAIWTPIFFGLRNPELALVIITALWATIFYLIIFSQKKLRIVSLLLVPYLIWVTFASCLNFAIVLLN